MIRRSVSSGNGRERQKHVSLSRRLSSETGALNGKGRHHSRSSTMTSRLPTILLIIFGMFGWVQWFIAVTRIHDTSSGASVLQQLMSSPVSSKKENPVMMVHQIQLGPTAVNEFHIVTHALPKQNDFERDWLGNSVIEQQDECQPMHAWQLPENAPSSSNLIHELSLDFSNKLGCGGDRCAVAIKDEMGHQVAFKTMRVIKDYYDTEDYHAGWMDAVVTEQLSSSPFVVDQYANCGLAQVLELGTSGTLMDHIILARGGQQGEYMSPEMRLKISVQVASAVADLHTMDKSNIPPIAHNDLCARQFLLIDGVYKLFDFDSASITKVNKNGTVCMEEPEHMDDQWDKIKAPEEFHRHARKDRIYKYKADIWVLGDILYYILTKKWVFEGISRDDAKLRMLAGIHSEIPLKHSSVPADRVLLKAIQMAWTENAEERPSAREISDFLHKELERIAGKAKGGIWRVSIPPLPANYNSTYAVFYDNLE